MPPIVMPWQQAQLDATAPAAAAIITGDAGIGAGGYALALANRFCGESQQPANPDLLITLPVNGNISVDAVRHIIDFLSLAPVSRDRRVAVVLRADCMHLSAANALLKTLEEPGQDKALTLWAPMLQQLPATIISRCRALRAPPPPADATDVDAAMLAFCGNRPLAVADYAPDWCETLAAHFRGGATLDIAAAAAALNVKHDGKQHWQQAVETMLAAGAPLNPHCLEWEEKNTAAAHGWLEGLQKWVADGVRAACALPPQFFPRHAETLRTLVGGKKRQWLDFHGALIERRALASHPLAGDLYIREILYAYRRLCAG